MRKEVEAWKRAGYQLTLDETAVGELWWAWAVRVAADGQQFRRLGPYLVDKFTRDVIPTDTGTSLHELERSRGYRAWWNFRGPRTVREIQYALRATEPTPQRDR